MDLELLSNNTKFTLDKCNPECLPFEESLDVAMKSAKEKTPEELEKQWSEEDKEAKENSEEYLEYIENLKYNLTGHENDDEYSSGEEIPTCNPWRE